MLSLVEQTFVERDEKRAPLKMPAWEATCTTDETKSPIKSMWEPGSEPLPGVYQDLSTVYTVGAMIGLFKKPLSICQSGLRDLIAASQTVIARNRLRLCQQRK